MADLVWTVPTALDLNLEGTGWGRLAIQSLNTTTLRVRVSHDVIDNFNQQRVDLYYSQKNYTFFGLFPEGNETPPWTGGDGEGQSGDTVGVPPCSYWGWWGLNEVPTSPFSRPAGKDNSIDERSSFVGNLTIPWYGVGVIIVVTNVPGYHINIADVTPGQSVPETGQPQVSLDWTLSVPPEQTFFAPILQQTTFVNQTPLYVERHRIWEEERTLNHSWVVSNSWHIRAPTTIRVGSVYDTESYLVKPGKRPANLPSSSGQGDLTFSPPPNLLIGGTSVGQSNIVVHPIREKGTYLMGRIRTDTYVGLENEQLGVGFLVIPLDIPNAEEGGEATT